MSRVDGGQGRQRGLGLDHPWILKRLHELGRGRSRRSWGCELTGYKSTTTVPPPRRPPALIYFILHTSQSLLLTRPFHILPLSLLFILLRLQWLWLVCLCLLLQLRLRLRLKLRLWLWLWLWLWRQLDLGHACSHIPFLGRWNRLCPTRGHLVAAQCWILPSGNHGLDPLPPSSRGRSRRGRGRRR